MDHLMLAGLRRQFRVQSGDDPMEQEEATDAQLSVVYQVVKAGGAPYTDFGVWGPYGNRIAKAQRFTEHFMDSNGTMKMKELKGPNDVGAWERAWRVFRTAAIMTGLATPATLDLYMLTSLSIGSTGTRASGPFATLRIKGAGPSSGRRSTGGSSSSTRTAPGSARTPRPCRGIASSRPAPRTSPFGTTSWTARRCSRRWAAAAAEQVRRRLPGKGPGLPRASGRRLRQGGVRSLRPGAVRRAGEATRGSPTTWGSRSASSGTAGKGAVARSVPPVGRMCVNCVGSRTGRSIAPRIRATRPARRDPGRAVPRASTRDYPWSARPTPPLKRRVRGVRMAE